jgi:hypothetical protein
MSPLVKTKRQANLKDFRRFGAFKELVEQKKRCIQLVRLKAHECQKIPIYTRTRQINFYLVDFLYPHIFKYVFYLVRYICITYTYVTS